ncbi:SWI/SNF chromatin-remodeling complex subunit [Nowakowskiella sp. JEL0407]|nr:SWI/SNF chromatin-remodeling complex subunit [Nowakowskiella sp. JEL0407]
MNFDNLNSLFDLGQIPNGFETSDFPSETDSNLPSAFGLNFDTSLLSNVNALTLSPQKTALISPAVLPTQTDTPKAPPSPKYTREEVIKQAQLIKNLNAQRIIESHKRKVENEAIERKMIRELMGKAFDGLRKSGLNGTNEQIQVYRDESTKKVTYHFNEKHAEELKDLEETLVPIRLDLEIEGQKLRDTFMWNLHEPHIKPEDYAQILCDDMKITGLLFQEFKLAIARSIREQLDDFYLYSPLALHPSDDLRSGRGTINVNIGDNVKSELSDDGRDGAELRIPIKLDITLDNLYLLDQFEWDIACHRNSPELFATEVVNELGLPSEFKSLIAHSIHEQIYTYRKSLLLIDHEFTSSNINDEDLSGAFLPQLTTSTLYRDSNSAVYFAPFTQKLQPDEILNLEKERERDSRKRRRQTNRSKQRIVTLPDREPPKTFRTPLPNAGSSGGAVGGGSDGAEGSRKQSNTQNLFDYSVGNSRSRKAKIGVVYAEDGEYVQTPPTTTSSLPNAEAAQPKIVATSNVFNAKDWRCLHCYRLPNETIIVRDGPGGPRHRIHYSIHKTMRKLAPADQTRIEKYNASIIQANPPPTHTNKRIKTSAAATPVTEEEVSGHYHHRTSRVIESSPEAEGIPDWLIEQKRLMNEKYPDDLFEIIKRQDEWRIKCIDCPGKVYRPGEGETLTNFEVHLKNRLHRLNVATRLEKF